MFDVDSCKLLVFTGESLGSLRAEMRGQRDQRHKHLTCRRDRVKVS